MFRKYRNEKLIACLHLRIFNKAQFGSSNFTKQRKKKQERMSKNRLNDRNFFPCVSSSASYSLIGRIWVTGRVCTRSNKNAFDICIRNESTCTWKVARHATYCWIEVYFRTRSELLTREGNGFGIACYAFVHVRGANEGFMEITQPIISLNG